MGMPFITAPIPKKNSSNRTGGFMKHPADPLDTPVVPVQMAPLFRTRAFLFLLFVSAVLAFLIFRPFLVSGILALISACVMRSMYLLYLRLFRQRPALAASISLVTVVLVVIIPLSLLLLLLIREGIRFVEFAQSNLTDWMKSIIELLDRLNQQFPFLHLDKVNLEDLLPRAFDEGLKFAMNIFNSAAQSGATFLFQAIVFLFCLYYFFIDWDRLGNWLGQISPFEASHNRTMYRQFLSMGRAVIKSTLIIGVIQGAVGGLALALAGVPSPLFWGLVMIILSLLPVIGSGLVWGPAGLMLIFSGRPVAGIVLILFGVIVIGNIDNFLRPRLVGGETSLHPLAVFLSTLGGLAFFGFSGFVLGPVIIAMITALINIYREELRPVWLEEGDQASDAL
jgi:predicted PurR-regulated permease PerM